jgi:hypothetical protein
MRFFASGFFYESISPQLQSILLGTFQIFSHIHGDFRKSRFHRYQQHWQQILPPVLLVLLITGFNDTNGKFATGVNDTVGK